MSLVAIVVADADLVVIDELETASNGPPSSGSMAEATPIGEPPQILLQCRSRSLDRRLKSRSVAASVLAHWFTTLIIVGIVPGDLRFAVLSLAREDSLMARSWPASFAGCGNIGRTLVPGSGAASTTETPFARSRRGA